LNTLSPYPLWAQLARGLRVAIIAAHLPIGTPLPSEADLSDQHGISRNTIRQAYSVLLDDGQVGKRQDLGYYVADAIEAEYIQVLPGATVTVVAADPDHHPHIPWWAVTAIKVANPGFEPIWYDPTRTVLTVS